LITVGDLGKNPVSEIWGWGRNRVFFEDIDTAEKLRKTRFLWASLFVRESAGESIPRLIAKVG